MSFLIGPMQKHLDGHKELTNHEDVLKAAENAQTDLDTVRDLIDMYKKDLKQYIDEKDNFYKKMRAKSAKKGQKD